MKYIFISLSFLLLNTSKSTQHSKIILCLTIEATCYGNNPCNACKTCNYCKHCNAGGGCGICAPLKKKQEKKKEETKEQKVPTTGQCKATTLKGTRCKRSASSNGFCWQHD